MHKKIAAHQIEGIGGEWQRAGVGGDGSPAAVQVRARTIEQRDFNVYIGREVAGNSERQPARSSRNLQ